MEYNKKIIINNEELEKSDELDYLYYKNIKSKNINIIKIKKKVKELNKKLNFYEKVSNNYCIEENLSETLDLLDKLIIKINNNIIKNGKINKSDINKIEFEF